MFLKEIYLNILYQGLLGDILDYESDLSADEDDVFNNKGAGYVDGATLGFISLDNTVD